jgi:CheY-like chemotaxis protein
MNKQPKPVKNGTKAAVSSLAPINSGTATPERERERPPRILLAEDDPTNRRVIGIMLRQANYTIDCAEDGLAAVDMWEKGDYDLVLMDVQMPRLTGFEATSAIREKERERGGHTPIVALTAHAYKEDEEKCRACGMDAHVAKPIDFKRCVEVIQGLLNRGSKG